MKGRSVFIVCAIFFVQSSLTVGIESESTVDSAYDYDEHDESSEHLDVILPTTPNKSEINSDKNVSSDDQSVLKNSTTNILVVKISTEKYSKEEELQVIIENGVIPSDSSDSKNPEDEDHGFNPQWEDSYDYSDEDYKHDKKTETQDKESSEEVTKDAVIIIDVIETKERQPTDPGIDILNNDSKDSGLFTTPFAFLPDWRYRIFSGVLIGFCVITFATLLLMIYRALVWFGNRSKSSIVYQRMEEGGTPTFHE